MYVHVCVLLRAETRQSKRRHGVERRQTTFEQLSGAHVIAGFFESHVNYVFHVMYVYACMHAVKRFT